MNESIPAETSAAAPENEMTMGAMLLDQPNAPLRWSRMPMPVPVPGQVLLRMRACGVCRTDLHIIDGELAPHKLPLVLGHEVVGEVVSAGGHPFAVGERIGVPWLGGTCGHCGFCIEHKENLCDQARFTGYDLDGGYAEYLLADARYCFRLPAQYDDLHAARLLCAGLIGYRAYAMTQDAQSLGLYGFGAAAHIVAQLARHDGKQVFAFTRSGDIKSQQFARSLGAVWAGGSDQAAPVLLDAAIIFAASGTLVPRALAATRKGATVVCAGIHMSDIPGFPYELLWGERQLRSVANLTRSDGDAFFAKIQQSNIQTVPVPFALQDANRALAALRSGSFEGAAVLLPD
jgi:propanol-preferring alcohol dehydrogenase